MGSGILRRMNSPEVLGRLKRLPGQTAQVSHRVLEENLDIDNQCGVIQGSLLAQVHYHVIALELPHNFRSERSRTIEDSLGSKDPIPLANNQLVVSFQLLTGGHAWNLTLKAQKSTDPFLQEESWLKDILELKCKVPEGV